MEAGTSITQLFDEFGDAVAHEFRESDFNEADFPAIAASALRAAAFHSALVFDDIVRWVLTAHNLPEQHDIDGTFGHPPLTVYSHPRFYVQLLVWTRGETTFHYHSFTGAFALLVGSSTEVRGHFDAAEVVSSHLQLGRFEIDNVSQLRVGDVREIDYSLAHVVHHDSRPTVSVVVRTHGETTGRPQYVCYWPSVAWNGFYHHRVTTRKLQLLYTLSELDRVTFAAALTVLLTTTDLHEIWSVLLKCISDGVLSMSTSKIAGILTERFGSRGRIVAEALLVQSDVRTVRDVMSAVGKEDDQLLWWLRGFLLCRDRRSFILYASPTFSSSELLAAFRSNFQSLREVLCPETVADADFCDVFSDAVGTADIVNNVRLWSERNNVSFDAAFKLATDLVGSPLGAILTERPEVRFAMDARALSSTASFPA